MKEKPIIFNEPMVRAILDGSKTQARIIMKPQPTLRHDGVGHYWPSKVFQTMVDIEGPTGFQGIGCEGMAADASPYGSHGDRLWVRETWAQNTGTDGGYVYPADHGNALGFHKINLSTGQFLVNMEKWRASTTMPRSASRIALEIVSVSVERLQEISEQDAMQEGIQLINGRYTFNGGMHESRTAKESFRALFESINGVGSWDANYFVWVINFKRVE